MIENANYLDTMASIAAIVVVSCAVYTDLCRRKISNGLTIPAAAVGIVLNTASGGWYGLLSSMAGLVIGIVVFIIPFALRGMGGGDVKLMGALGALLGAYAIVSVAIYTALMGGALAIIVAMYNRQLGHSVHRALGLLRRLVPFGRKSKGIDKTKSLRLPYGVAIFMGTVLLFTMGHLF